MPCPRTTGAGPSVWRRSRPVVAGPRMQATRFGGAGCRWGDAHALAGLPVSARRASPISKWTGRGRRAGLRWRTGSRAGSAGSLGTSRGVDPAGAARDGHLGPAGAEHAQAHRRVEQAHVPPRTGRCPRRSSTGPTYAPTRCWFGGGGRAEEAGSRPRTGGSYALAANTVCESATTIHGPHRSIEPTQP
jgi:hypothetical protein